MVVEIFDDSVCTCCGKRCSQIDMQIGLTITIDPNILKIMISSESKIIKRPSRIHLSTNSNDYVICDSTLENQFLTFVIYVINL